MNKASKIGFAIAFFGALGSFILNIGNGWQSYVWQLITMLWIANSYITELQLNELRKK